MTHTASGPGRRSVLVAAAASAAAVPLSGGAARADGGAAAGTAPPATVLRLFAPTGPYPVGAASAFSRHLPR